MWEVSPWQYFTATIVSFDSNTLQYTIVWDDQDPSGRIVDYYNLALDRVPEHDEIAIGSVVLFPQGKYKGQEGVRLGGQRYHQVNKNILIILFLWLLVCIDSKLSCFLFVIL